MSTVAIANKWDTDVGIISLTEKFVKAELSKVDSSHDWLHIERVRKNALYLTTELNNNLSDGNHEKWFECESSSFHVKKRMIDLELVELAALLHDVGDFKYTKDEEAGGNLIRKHLESIHYCKRKTQMIIDIVEHLSYRKELYSPNFWIHLIQREGEEGSKDESSLWGFELAVVQDADRLDAIGAIGIARCFTYGAAKGHPLYCFNEIPLINMNGHQYSNQTISNKGNPIHHFYEKLFKVKEKIKTLPGRRIAQERHEFMVAYVRQFEKEVGLKSYDLN